MNNNIPQNSSPSPFESYPHQGRILLGRVSGDKCRRGYGLTFMRLTGQTKCAYCGKDLAGTYESWVTMALDHAIPTATCKKWELPEKWGEDYSNRVLSCGACNGFKNRDDFTVDFQCPSTVEEFYERRDAIFLERRRRILDSHKQERIFFDKKPWAS